MGRALYFGTQLFNVTPTLFLFALLYEAVRTWEVNALLFASGLLLNGLANFGLKSLFKKPRPCQDAQCSTMFEGQWNHKNGMPSGHAQFFGFFLTYLTASIVAQKTYNASTCYLLAASYIIGIAVIVTRVTSGCHTVQQVAAGLFVGIALGFVMFAAVYYGKRDLLYPTGPI